MARKKMLAATALQVAGSSSWKQEAEDWSPDSACKSTARPPVVCHLLSARATCYQRPAKHCLNLSFTNTHGKKKNASRRTRPR